MVTTIRRCRAVRVAPRKPIHTTAVLQLPLVLYRRALPLAFHFGAYRA
jgi:hypothetical protein